MFGIEEHADYIFGAYAGVATLTVGVIVMTLLGSRRARARLKALEAQGIRRRSDRSSAT